MERQKMHQVGIMKREFFPEIRRDMWVLRWKDFLWIGESWKEVMKKGIQKEKELRNGTHSSHKKQFD